jgi:predicted O-methyltransferase YrrM
VFEDKKIYPDYVRVENLKRELLKDKREIEVQDFGAGSSVDKDNIKVVGRIAKYSSKPKKYARLLYRLVKYFQPGTILELGTSLGLSTAYMASARPEAKVITIEGCPNISAIAQENFDNSGIKNVKLVTGEFDRVLPEVLTGIDKPDFVFIDGNHRKEPTIRYFEMCLEKAHNDSVFIFDDIHWSEGMTEAWDYICKHPSVTLSVDIFAMGLIFFKKELSKEHFIVKY